MAKRRRDREWTSDEGGLPDLDSGIDHGHDHELGGLPDRFFGSQRDRDRQLDRDRIRDEAFDLERRLDREFDHEFARHDEDAPVQESRRMSRPTSERSRDPGLDDELSFQEDLNEVTPHVLFTWVFFGANIAVFALLVLLYRVPFMTPRAQDMLPWGANFAPYTTSGEWWRLFTCMFLHFGLLHLGFNMWILKEIGPLVERLVGNVGFLIVYLGSGLVASMASTWWNPESVSAGASGAIFGVIGALLGVLILGHGTIPKASLSRLRRAVTTFVVFNIYIGLNAPGIDMAAHLGGLGVGLLCGMIMTREDMLDTAQGRDGRNLAATAICGLCVLWGLVLIPQSGSSVTRTLLDFDRVRVESDATYDVALVDMEQGRVDDEAFAQVVEGLLVELRGMQLELAGLQDLEPPQAAAAQQSLEYLAIRIEGWEALVEGLRTDEEAKFTLWQEREREAERLEREFR